MKFEFDVVPKFMRAGFVCAGVALWVLSPVQGMAQDVSTDVPPPIMDPQELIQDITPDAQGVASMPAQKDLGAPGTSADTNTNAEALGAYPGEVASDSEFDENVFFDANELVPTGEMGRKGGPVKVNPRLQPGAKLVVVRKDSNAGGRAAQMVAAERAMKLGRYGSALEIYDRLYQVNKRDPNVLMGKAVALQRLGRDDEAIGVHENLLTLRPNNVEASVNMLGLMGQRYPSVALQRLLDLSEKNPENVGVLAQVAVVQAKLGDYQAAVRYLGMAASMEPQNASHVYNMAVIADRAGSKVEAIKYYEQALETDTLYGNSQSIPRDSIYERLAQLR